MVEPVSLLVLNSFLAARFSAARCASAHTSTAMLSLTTTRTSPSSFFTPNPRRCKGKARASSQDPSIHTYFEASRPWCSDSIGDVSFGYWSSVSESLPSRPSDSTSSRSHSYRHSVGTRTLASHRRYSTPRHLGLKLTDADQRRHAHSARRTTVVPEVVMKRLSNIISLIVDRKKSPSSKRDAVFDSEEAWEAFVAAEQWDVTRKIHFEELLSLLNKFVTDAEQYYVQPDGSAKLELWGGRIQTMIDVLETRVWNESQNELLLESLRVRSFAMLGRFDEATDLLDQLRSEDNPHLGDSFILETHQEILLAMRLRLGPVQAFDWLFTRWTVIRQYLDLQRTYTKTKYHLFKPLRTTVLNIVDDIDFPAAYLADHCREWPLDRRKIVAEFLVLSLCELDLPKEALFVVDEMQRQSLVPPIPLQLILIKAMVREKSFELANTLYSTVSQAIGSGPHSQAILSTGLYVFAHQGDIQRAREGFDLLEQQKWLTPRAIALMLHATAVNGQTTETIRFFEHYFPLDAPETELTFSKPTVVHFSEVILAHAQRSDTDGINSWLEKMSAYGCLPDALVYTKVLKCFAMRGDVESIARVLNQMRTAGFPPSRFDYTTIISLLAQRKDAVAAESIYHRALEEGVVPDRVMVSALMHAHVEAGSWQGVVRAFDYMAQAKDRRLRPSIEVLNTLLKAYVLIGAPFNVISRVFSRLDKAGVRPTARTFSLLIQSACDAGHMDIATDLFKEMDKLAERWQSSLHINVYVLTLIMNGYLKQGNKHRAKEIYDEMQNRGILPTAVTLGTIINDYAADKTEESLKLAEDFLQSLVNGEPAERDWDMPSGARRSALEIIYHPLMDAYAKENRTEDTERLFKNMLDSRGEPTLGTLTVLLDAYRRSGDIEAVRQVWPQIFQLGLKNSQASSLTGEEFVEDSMPISPKPSAILCIPLSIYIDALSTAGYHLEIAETWKKFQINNFAFDSHNWNHLTVALVRAGEPERAFEVLERVILPYQRQADSMYVPRDKWPESPLTFNAATPPSAEVDYLPNPFVESPMHNMRRRGFAVGQATKRLQQWLGDKKDKPDDFAHPLHVLQQISPSWGTWMPHTVTLGVLSKVLAHLSSGRMIQPLKPEEDSEVPRVFEDEATIRTKQELAAEILRRIYTDFPEAVWVVEGHELRERSRTEQQLEFEQQRDILWT